MNKRITAFSLNKQSLDILNSLPKRTRSAFVEKAILFYHTHAWTSVMANEKPVETANPNEKTTET